MGKNRLEAFSDGVFAIIITIMVLEMKVPHGDTVEALRPLWAVFLSYLLSFTYVGIYWNNHHHLLHTVDHVSAGVLWANLYLLFCLSLVPFVTGWMGENNFAAQPTAIYGVALLMAAASYTVLTRAIIASQGQDSLLKRAIADDWKGNVSLVMYIVAVVSAVWMPAFAGLLYAGVAIMWLVPDRRIERVISTHHH